MAKNRRQPTRTPRLRPRLSAFKRGFNLSPTTQRLLHNKWKDDTRRYYLSYNASRRGTKFFNRFRPRETITNIRYKQTWGAGQSTLQRPVYRPLPPNYNPQFPRGVLPPSQSPLASWYTPQLRYEQQNKDWTQYQPFTLSDYNAMAPLQRQTPALSLYHNRPTSFTRKITHKFKMAKRIHNYYMLPPGRVNRSHIPNINRLHVRAGLTGGGIGIILNKWKQTPDQTLSNFNKPLHPCMHWSARLQKNVPCSETFWQKRPTFSKSRYAFSSYQHRGRPYHRSKFNQLYPATHTRYYRRRP